MITLSLSSVQLTKLMWRVADPSAAISEQVTAAVKAQSQLDDPLRDLMETGDKLHAIITLTNVVNWLVDNAPFQKPDLDPLTAWHENIATLATQHIKANYLQGYAKPHPQFWLIASPMQKKEGQHTYEPRAMAAEHWILFVQAVYAHIWLTADHIRRGGNTLLRVRTEAIRSFLYGVIDTLAKTYPEMGEDTDSYVPTIRSIAPETASIVWQQNITVISVKHSLWLDQG